MDDDVEIEIREVDADFADKNEDQIMEEGELSDENEPATDKFSRQKRSLADRLGPKLNTRRNYADDVEERSRSRLPVRYILNFRREKILYKVIFQNFNLLLI